MSFIIEKEEIEVDNNSEPDNNNNEIDNNSEPDNNDDSKIIINEKKKYNFTPARAKALAKGRLKRANNLAINKLKVNRVNKDIEKGRSMKLIS
jgi:hypothetical protein